MKISIICPIRNDITHFENLITNIQKIEIKYQIEIIVVNDASDDASEIDYEKILQSANIKYKYIYKEQRIGISGAIYLGALKAEYQNVLILEGDNEISPKNLKAMFAKKQETDADVIQGVAVASLSHNASSPSKASDRIIRFFLRNNLQAPTSLFILSDRNLVINILRNYSSFNYKHHYISSLASKKGYLVEEVVSSKKSTNKKSHPMKNLWIQREVLFDVLKKEFDHSLPLMNYQPTLSVRRRIRMKLYFWTFPLHKWVITSDSFRYYKSLKALEFCGRDEIEKISQIRLRRILLHCFNNVPYYSNLWTEIGIKHEDFYKPGFLQRLPMLTKENVTANRDSALFSRNSKREEVLEIKTSGSSGQPFITFADRFQLEVRFATTMRALEMTGYKFGDRQLRLWHQKIGMSKFQARAERIDAWFLRRKFIPAFELNSQKLKELNETLQTLNPILIDGYAESMNYLAGNSEIQGSVGALQGIMTSAQELTKPSREAIEGKFGVSVFDKYGSREFSGIAYECREGRVRHVQDESYVVEIITGGRLAEPGEIGEVVITDLNNYTFPLIRYRIGDLALCLAQVSCACGRPLSQVGPIQGRSQALVLCSNGVWLPGTFFAHFFKEYEGVIKFFQIVQSEESSFTLKYVRAEDFTYSEFEVMQVKLREFIGAEMIVNYEPVKEIPLLKTGKRTPVISHLKPDFQEISK